jgi:DNA transposition AAA+ family ATPase
MNITPELTAQLEATLPPTAETIAKMREYMAKADMTIPQFAQLCGRSRAGINNLLQNAYTKYNIASDLLVRRAVEETMLRYPVTAPEQSGGPMFETENSAELRYWFQHCHANRALAYCYGPPGSQKTFVLKHLVAEFNCEHLAAVRQFGAYYVYASTRMQPRDLMVKICQACDALPAFSLQRCMNGLRFRLRTEQAVVVIDEAQHLSIDCLEALRELHDEDPRIGVLLAGSHTLKRLFTQRAAELEQWNSRLDAGIELRGVSSEQARLIVKTQMSHLKPGTVEGLITGATVQDPYSSRDGARYINVRRLFKNMEALARELKNKKKQLKGAAA